MSPVNRKALFARFKGNPPASLELIDRCQAGLGVLLPADYVQFLLQMDGGEGFIGEHYLMLWSVERFVEMNTGTYFARQRLGWSVPGWMAEARRLDSRSAGA